MSSPLSKYFVCLLVLIGCIIRPATLSAQTVEAQMMTRGRMWIKAYPNGALEREQSNPITWLLAYPGYWGHNNNAGGGFDNNFVYHGAQVRGIDAAWTYRNNKTVEQVAGAMGWIPTKLNKNYNLAVDATQPEEYITGTMNSPAYDALGKPHMGYTLEGKIMGWSIPRYSDFLIIRCKLTNVDTSTLANFYYARCFAMTGPYRPNSVSPGWDKEYLWDSEVSDTLGFIFYDDNTKDPNGNDPAYSIPPGNMTGNAGDPGNIGIQGSNDYKLYSPWVYAYSFLPSQIPINKEGERKVWRTIVSTDANAPSDELMLSPVSDPNYSTLVEFIRNKPQPKVSWRAAYDSIRKGYSVPGAGSLWERNPRYIYAIGPYDIAPGKSIEWIEVLVAGGMDRNITMRGDTAATLHFVQAGLKNLKQNWAAASALVENDYRIPYGDIPPPTPADAPLVFPNNSANELRIEPALSKVNGAAVVGVTITWKAVHRGYKDPQLRRNDFALYKIYRSGNSIEGPWELIDSLTQAKADSFYSGGKIFYFIKAQSNVPYRYCVTSVDSSGNECAKTGYNFYPVAAEPEASNKLSTILVVPNPFKQQSGFPGTDEKKRLTFVNIPAQCTIRIYTLALDLVRTIEHTEGGVQSWGTQSGKDYMMTDFGQNVMPGLYIFHVESHVPGHEGETSVGKFMVIK